jgi:hypothetical protein
MAMLPVMANTLTHSANKARRRSIYPVGSVSFCRHLWGFASLRLCGFLQIFKKIPIIMLVENQRTILHLPGKKHPSSVDHPHWLPPSALQPVGSHSNSNFLRSASPALRPSQTRQKTQWRLTHHGTAAVRGGKTQLQLKPHQNRPQPQQKKGHTLNCLSGTVPHSPQPIIPALSNGNPFANGKAAPQTQHHTTPHRNKTQHTTRNKNKATRKQPDQMQSIMHWQLRPDVT